MAKYSKQSGFSIIEMLVVLTIIGLLFASITGGASLIRTAKLKAVISEVKELEQAMATFEEKYRYLPGDFTNAVALWGASTVNGDGDYIIDCCPGGGEHFRAYQHMSLSGMLDQAYTGTGGLDIDRNIKGSTISPGMYWLRNFSAYGVTGNVINLGSRTNSFVAANSILTALDAYNIDEKIDDGLSDSGYAMAAYGNELANGCTTNTYSSGSSSYVFTGSDVNCRMIFWYERRPTQ